MQWSVIIGLAVVSAVPIFHQVNDFDVNGQACVPHVTHMMVDCPVLCVQSAVDCPANYPMDVPSVSNFCDCNPRGGYKSCQQISTLQVPIAEKDNSTAWCLDQYNVSQNLGLLNSSGSPPNTSDPLILNCGSEAADSASSILYFNEWPFLLVYGLWAAFVCFNLIWYFVKQSLEAPITALSLQQNEEKYYQHAYKENIFGNFLFVYLIALSIVWQFLFFFICMSYYAFIPYHSNIVEPFILTWHLATVWYIFLKVKEGTLRNWYRLRTHFSECTSVEIWSKDDPTIYMEYNTKIMQYFRGFSKWYEAKFGASGSYETVFVQKTSKGTRYIDSRCSRYTFNEKKNIFENAVVETSSTNTGFLQMLKGLTAEEANYRLEMLGPNFIAVNVSSIIVSLLKEFSSPFYIYQICILWIWFYWSYANMGAVQLTVIVISGIIKVVVKRMSELKIKSMAEHVANVTVLRDSDWVNISSQLLVPGDVIWIKHDDIVQCDVVLVSGTVAMDESMLTGESMPVQKFPVTDDGQSFAKMGHSKKSVLFAGTRIIQVEPAKGEEKVQGVVESTGSASEKGKLVSSILFRSNVVFIFDQQLKVVLMILVLWAIIIMSWVLVANLSEGPGSWLTGIFVVCQIISPLLPSVLVIGQSVSANRLRERGVYCVNLHRVTIAGKVRIFCFDKTGTLTKEGLEFHGVVPFNTENSKIGSLIDKAKELPVLLQIAMGSAQTITVIDEQYVGNPVDVSMFTAAGWKLKGDEITNGDLSFTILKKFEFVHARMSMSVAVQDMASKEIHIFMKGSFEKIKELSIPSSVPENFDQVTHRYAASGCYTLGLAHRSLGVVPPETIESLSRDEFEQGCSYVGLLLFRNNLKETSEEAMNQLKDGNVRPVMITGDNALTGIFIAHECNMTTKKSTVILADVPSTLPTDADKKEEKKSGEWTAEDLVWKNAATGEVVNMAAHLQEIIDEAKNETTDTFKESTNDMELALTAKSRDSIYMRTKLDNLYEEGDVELALTGKAFNVLCKSNIMSQILLKCRIFARMTPQDKVRCVQMHMEKEITGMCGDGGNDCGALRVAHVGLAMSKAEASIVSPFSTTDPSPLAVVQLLKEGRAALATSVSSYKFLIMYGETIVMSKTMYTYYAASLAEWVWIICDGIFVTSLSYALTLSKPRERLAPLRPTARLLGPETLISTIGVILINALFSVFGMVLLSQQSFYACNEHDGNNVDITLWWLLADNYEGETLGFIVIFQVFTAAGIGNFGSYFRQQWYKNVLFVVAFLSSFIMTSCMLLLDPNPLGCWFRFNCGDPAYLVEHFNCAEPCDWALGPPPKSMYNNQIHHNIYPRYFRIILFCYCMGNTVIVGIFQRFFVLGPVREWARKKRPLKKRQFGV